MLSSVCSGNSHTARGAWSKYRPIRFRRVRSARVAFPIARLHFLQAHAMSGLMPDMPVLLTRHGKHSARQAPVFVVKWCTRLGTAWARLWTRRLESEFCHCQLCVSWVGFPRQSRVAVRHTASLSWPGPNLAFCDDTRCKSV